MKRKTRIRKGLYELLNLTHGSRRPGEPACGGVIRAEWFPGQWDDNKKIAPSWEFFCVKCLDCDANGYDTLSEGMAVASEAWS